MALRRTGCRATAVLAAFVILLSACGDAGVGLNKPPAGVPSCGAAPFLTSTPVNASDLSDVAPLGNLNPPGHVFPTDHLYFYSGFISGGSIVRAVYAPGNITVTAVTQQTRTGGGIPPVVDYSMTFFACSDVMLYYGHISGLTTNVADLIGTIGDCETGYSTGGFDYVQCRKNVSFNLAAGTPIGTFGGPGEGALDLGGYDRRVPQLGFVAPERSYGNGTAFGQNRAICPLDYMTTDVRDALRAKLGGRGMRRTATPLCGSIMQDVANSAQGRWYFGDAVHEDPHLALAHDNVDPSVGDFSVGTSIATLPSGVYDFVPATSGRVNVDFWRVGADGELYCYEPRLNRGRHILVQLVSATRLRIEGRAGIGCGDPSLWQFDSEATDFAR